MRADRMNGTARRARTQESVVDVRYASDAENTRCLPDAPAAAARARPGILSRKLVRLQPPDNFEEQPHEERHGGTNRDDRDRTQQDDEQEPS